MVALAEISSLPLCVRVNAVRHLSHVSDVLSLRTLYFSLLFHWHNLLAYASLCMFHERKNNSGLVIRQCNTCADEAVLCTDVKCRNSKLSYRRVTARQAVSDKMRLSRVWRPTKHIIGHNYRGRVLWVK